MRDPYWRLFESPADQGAADDEAPDEPIEEPDDDGDGEPEPEEMYTRAELTEMLGPRFAERYAGAHEGPEAFKKFAESFEETLKHVNKLSHGEQIDEDAYRALGLEPPEPEPEYVEEPEPLYGAPWAPPQSWDELVELAGRNPRAAAEFALAREDLPNETKAWFFANWASVDAAGAFEYNQAATTKAAQEYADRVAASIREQVDPLVHDRMVANSQLLLSKAAELIPGFSEHAPAISKLMDARQARNPNYHEWFLNATLGEQLEEMRDLTGIAVYRNQPAIDAEAQEELDATEADKTRAKTETSRTGGGRGGSSAQSDFKKKNLADFRKLKEQGVI